MKIKINFTAFVLSLAVIGMPIELLAKVISGEYEIQARHSGKCLDVPRSSKANGIDIIQYKCNRTTNQIWKVFEGPSGYYTIKAKHSDKCLDVSQSSTDNGAKILQFHCYYTHNQQWEIIDLSNGYFHIKARHSGKALDVPRSSTANGTKITQLTSHRTHNQQWKLRNIQPISETIRGTVGDDKIYFGYDNDQMRLKALVNNQVLLYSKTGHTFKIEGGNGNDIIKAIENTKINGHQFGALNHLNFRQYKIMGGRGNDHIEGTPFYDHIKGGDGNDYLVGKNGIDDIEGEDGHDVIQGWEGNDVIIGGNGHDYLFGDRGTDRINGGDGNDVLVGGRNDILTGGAGRDTRHCRTNINGDERYDLNIDYNDFPGNCSNPDNLVDVESTNIKDPYHDWAYMYYFSMVDGELIRIKYTTTSSMQRLLNDRSSGASMLIHNNEPLHTVHKQYNETCGPSSLSMIMEYLELADRSRRIQLPRDLDTVLATPTYNRPWNSKINVDVGYFLSTEHIMYEGYHWQHHNGWPLPNNYLDSQNRLDISTGPQEQLNETGEFKGIDYPIGDISVAANGTVKGRIQNWMKQGPAVGTNPLDPDYGLAYIANKFVIGQRDAVSYHSSQFDNIEHIKRTIRGFIDHSIPLLVSVYSGGHFCVIMGYRMVGANLYVYLANPVDGWGSNPYYSKSMRWQKILLTNDVLRSGLISELMVFNHSNIDNGCATEGWARTIDNDHDRNNLCGHVLNN